MAKVVSGSSTSTGSFGTLGVGTTGGSNGYGLHIKSSGISTYPLFIEASDGSNLGGLYEGASGHGAFYVRDASGTAQVALNSDGSNSSDNAKCVVLTAPSATEIAFNFCPNFKKDLTNPPLL